MRILALDFDLDKDKEEDPGEDRGRLTEEGTGLQLATIESCEEDGTDPELQVVPLQYTDDTLLFGNLDVE